MNFTLRLTLDGLVGALRMKAHSLGDDFETRRRPKPPQSPETEPKPGRKAQPQTKGESNGLARG